MILKSTNKQKNKKYKIKQNFSKKYNIDINKIGASNKQSFGEKGFEYLIGHKDPRKIDLYVYFFQKFVHIEGTSVKLKIHLFL